MGRESTKTNTGEKAIYKSTTLKYMLKEKEFEQRYLAWMDSASPKSHRFLNQHSSSRYKLSAYDFVIQGTVRTIPNNIGYCYCA